MTLPLPDISMILWWVNYSTDKGFQPLRRALPGPPPDLKSPRVRIGKKTYARGRVAWYLSNNCEDPGRAVIKFRNGDSTDYRRSNMYLAARESKNSRIGVHPTEDGRWAVRLRIDGRLTTISTHSDRATAEAMFQTNWLIVMRDRNKDPSERKARSAPRWP